MNNSASKLPCQNSILKAFHMDFSFCSFNTHRSGSKFSNLNAHNKRKPQFGAASPVRAAGCVTGNVENFTVDPTSISILIESLTSDCVENRYLGLDFVY